MSILLSFSHAVMRSCASALLHQSIHVDCSASAQAPSICHEKAYGRASNYLRRASLHTVSPGITMLMSRPVISGVRVRTDTYTTVTGA